MPQRLLIDNGAALNPTRRGQQGRLVEHVRALGVEAITSKPPPTAWYGSRASRSSSPPHARQRAAVTWDTERIIFSTLDGEILAEHTWPEPSTTYVSTHTPDPANHRGGRGHKKNPQLSPMS